MGRSAPCMGTNCMLGTDEIVRVSPVIHHTEVRCKASRNGSPGARVPSLHTPEHHGGLQEKGQSLDRALGC